MGEIYGRKLDWDLRTGQPAHLYLPGAHRGVWNSEGLSGGEVIICESLIDALSFWCAGYRNVTATYGTAGFTEDHRAAFSRHKVCRVLIAYDHDDAGDGAAQKLAVELVAAGAECLRVVFPRGADANDVAVGADDPARELGRYLSEARWLGGAPAGRVPPTVPDVPAKGSSKRFSRRFLGAGPREAFWGARPGGLSKPGPCYLGGRVTCWRTALERRMEHGRMEHEGVLREIVDWAGADEDVRAVVLTGSGGLGRGLRGRGLGLGRRP